MTDSADKRATDTKSLERAFLLFRPDICYSPPAPPAKHPPPRPPTSRPPLSLARRPADTAASTCASCSHLIALRPRRRSCRCSARSTPTSRPPLASRSASTHTAALLLQLARRAQVPTVSEQRCCQSDPCRPLPRELCKLRMRAGRAPAPASTGGSVATATAQSSAAP